MADYIEREAALESVREKLRISEALPDSIAKRASVFTLASMNDSLKSIPAADVRPVILCKDCTALRDGISYCMYWGEYVNDSGYCSYGKKREGS